MSKHKVLNGGYHYDENWKRQEVVLSCGTGSGIPLPIYNGIPLLNGTAPTCPLVGNVSLDTTNLVKPTVKIDFSCVVNFISDIGFEGGYITIPFTLSKVCEGDCIPVGTWNYQRSINLSLLGQPPEPPPAEPVDGGVQFDFRESFGFTWCECQQCTGCSTYVVEVANVQAYNVQSGSITNVSISALAVGC